MHGRCMERIPDDQPPPDLSMYHRPTPTSTTSLYLATCTHFPSGNSQQHLPQHLRLAIAETGRLIPALAVLVQCCVLVLSCRFRSSNRYIPSDMHPSLGVACRFAATKRYTSDERNQHTCGGVPLEQWWSATSKYPQRPRSPQPRQPPEGN